MYTPLLPPGVGDARFGAALDYVYRELRRLEEELKMVHLPELHAEPLRPRDGMVVFADGTDWEPVTSGGIGFYGYYSGAWHKLG